MVIIPRRINSFTPDVVFKVKCAVKKTDAEVRHSDLVGVGEAERDPALDLVLVFYYLPILTARVSAGLKHLLEY